MNLGKEKITKLLISFSAPCIISMLINSIYNIVDQIFIGKGVGTVGNAATNVIFPLMMLCGATAGLVGNGCAANLSLRLGEGNTERAKKSLGTSILLLIFFSLLISITSELLMPTIIKVFGCTDTIYPYALTYGRIILAGASFNIFYSGLSSVIRADGSPKFAMFSLVIGAIINLILDPIFIFVFKMGVAGGALATILGQFVSFVISIIYLFNFKSIKISRKDLRLNSETLRTLGLGISSFVTQCTVLVLFVVMNNLMTKYGALTKYGSDIPLSVYGVISKVNSIYLSFILGIAIGAQPIIGFNYGAGNYDRVKETLKKILGFCMCIGIIYNLVVLIFPYQIASIFITKTDPSYKLFMEFAVDFARIFLMVSALNFFEICTSISVQSLGNVKKATFVSFARQIILFVPLALILTKIFGLYGALYASPIADFLCFILVIFVFGSEYKKLSKLENEKIGTDEKVKEKNILKNKTVITISREYGSGGRYVGELLANSLGIPFYDKELIHMTALESGLSEKYIKEMEQTKTTNYLYNNDDKIFVAESKVIKKLAKDSCVIVGRCADYVLDDNKNVFKVFIYSSKEDKVSRAVKYYGLKKENALKQIEKINKQRAKHYKYYTERNWYNFDNYDLIINVDTLGVNKASELIKNIIIDRKDV